MVRFLVPMPIRQRTFTQVQNEVAQRIFRRDDCFARSLNPTPNIGNERTVSAHPSYRLVIVAPTRVTIVRTLAMSLARRVMTCNLTRIEISSRVDETMSSDSAMR